MTITQRFGMDDFVASNGWLDGSKHQHDIRNMANVGKAGDKIACVASVSMGFPHKISMFWPRKNWGESKKERGGRGRGEKEMLAVKPLDFENPVCQRTGLVIGSALVLIIDMCPSKI